ncbi:Alpha/Beta hydrolase protein [Boletus coccyginus]|nr:Alpha/Beta hydrolase protein [Boletus coccyginus]
MAETSFTISVPDGKLDLLRSKLELATLPDELDDAGWKYGVPLSDIKRLVARWRSGYDWRTHEKALNDALPMFTRDIDVDGFGTLDIHYVHAKSTVKNAIPLLYCHGWPGTFHEVKKLLPLLTTSFPGYPSFHVVTLSLPGYGFSEAPRKKGFTIKQYAEVAHKLMLSLGYDEYVTQGGDLGYFSTQPFQITRHMAIEYGGKNDKAWHTTMPHAQPPSLLKEPLSYLTLLFTSWTPKEKEGLARTQWFQDRGSGYLAEHTTQPQTLGYSLADSPVGLLAWIYEKLRNWADNYPWEDDEILTWVSIYWFSRAGPAASLRIYFEFLKGESTLSIAPEYPKIPMGVSFFPKEIMIFPKAWIRRGNRMVAEFEHDSGGHFAAHETPNELAHDLRRMFGKGGGAYGVVPGKDGYP